MLGTSDTILNGRRWPPILFGAVCHLIYLTYEREETRRHADKTDTDNEYHLLRLPCYLEYSHRLEMGLLYPLRGGVWIKWPSHGVSPLFTLFTRKGKERRRKLTVKQLGSWNLLRRQRRTSPGYRQHEWNGVCLPGLVAAGCLATGGCAAVSEGVYYCDYHVGDFDYYYWCYKGVGAWEGGGFEVVLYMMWYIGRIYNCNTSWSRDIELDQNPSIRH